MAQGVTKFIKRGDTRGHVGAIVCSDKVVAIHRANCGTVIVSAATGDVLWHARAGSILFVKDIMVRKGGGPAYLNSLTGTEVVGVLPKFNLGGGCGLFTISSNLVCGQMGVTFDFTNQKPLDDAGCGPLFHKGPCLSGSLVGEGLVASASLGLPLRLLCPRHDCTRIRLPVGYGGQCRPTGPRHWSECRCTAVSPRRPRLACLPQRRNTCNSSRAEVGAPRPRQNGRGSRSQ